MSEISRYVDHLPPVLWSQEYDSEQFLGRMLRIFEKILTGITIDAQVVRASAHFAHATTDRIVATRTDDIEKFTNFRVGDVVTIGDPSKRAEITNVARTSTEAILFVTLSASHAAGTVRIADLIAGQERFRVDDVSKLGPGIPIQIRQAARNEQAVIEKVEDGFVQLRSGLAQVYWMAEEKVPVRLSDPQPLVSIQETIDKLHELFNPWTTRADPEFLDWLASWVALVLREDWSEFQKRKLIAEMVSIYQLRGLKRGLQAYLDIYAATPARPRIAIDTGEALFRARFAEDGTARLYAVAHSQAIRRGVGEPELVLSRPTAIAIDRDGNCVVADEVLPFLPGRIPQPTAIVWRITNGVEVEYMSTMSTRGDPRPRRFCRSDSGRCPPLFRPKAIVVDSQNRYSLLVQGGQGNQPGIYRFSRPSYVFDSATRVHDGNPLSNPVDMILDDTERFIVLDAGDRADGVRAKIVILNEDDHTIQEHVLRTVVYPRSIAMDPEGRYVVADAKDQNSSDPADLIRVDPADSWGETSLLGGIAAGKNPLVDPTGLVLDRQGILYVCDTGLRALGPIDPEGIDLSYRYKANQAAVYRVDLSRLPSVAFMRITTNKELVYPTKIALSESGTLFVVDIGEFIHSRERVREHYWRAKTNEFGVTVHFPSEDGRSTEHAERKRIRQAIADVVEKEKPCQSTFWMDF